MPNHDGIDISFKYGDITTGPIKIDTEIFEIVRLLWSRGFKTSMSCEGDYGEMTFKKCKRRKCGKLFEDLEEKKGSWISIPLNDFQNILEIANEYDIKYQDPFYVNCPLTLRKFIRTGCRKELVGTSSIRLSFPKELRFVLLKLMYETFYDIPVKFDMKNPRFPELREYYKRQRCSECN